MTLAQIKDTLNIKALDLARQMEKDSDVPTPWLRNWNNLTRTSTVIHEDVLKEIKADPARKDLALKSEVKESEGGDEYTNHIIIIVKNIEDTL